MMPSANLNLFDHKAQPVIAFLIEELSVGGAEHMLMIMANEFSLRGWTVHMICLSRAGELASRLDDSVQLHVLNKQLGIDPKLPFRLLRCIDEIRPDILNSHLWVANAWTRFSLLARKIPIVVTEHSRDNWKPYYYRWLDKLLAKRSSRMVTVSADTADFYEKVIGIDRTMITVINNGVDTALYANGRGEALRDSWFEHRKLSRNDKRVPFLIGTVGRLVVAKNHIRLIDAVARLINDDALSNQHEIHLKIVGEGPERSRLQRHIDALELGEFISLAGARHDIPDVLAAFDVFALSSDREGHPLTALESQAAGTPVVLTNAGGSSEAIARQGDLAGGVLVPTSVDALSEALREFVVDSELRATRSGFARQFARENFDKSVMLDRYEAVFRQSILS